MYHSDLPQPLQDLGGLTNASLAVWFSDYARLLFDIFGNDVKNWITFNEGDIICNLGYEEAITAPGITGYGVQGYLCAHNLIKAHAKVWRMYHEEYRPKQNGNIKLT